MKKLFILMFCMILLIGNVSALEIDDIKVYDKNLKTYSLDNFFGFGKHIADLELKTPQDFKVPRGYQKVAEVDIKNGEFDYDEIINGMELYNIIDDMKEFVRDVDYKYKTIIKVPKYKTICIDKELVNNTIVKECSVVQDGTKDKVKWLDFTNNSLLKGENITLGIFTEVKKGDKVEWIINVYGNERLTAWAVWTENLNVGLMSYWKLDDQDIVNGSGVIIDSSGSNDGDNIGMLNTTGLINTGYENDGTDRSISMGDVAEFDGIDNLSMSIWVNVTTAENLDSLISKRGGGLGYQLLQDASGKWEWLWETAGGESSATSTTSVSIGNWQNIIIMYEDGNGSIFIDGVLEDDSQAISGNLIANAVNFTLARHATSSTSFLDGVIDEIGIWNRSLTQSEITDLYNGGAGLPFRRPNFPEVSLNSPIDNFNTTNQTIIFNGSVVSNNFRTIVNVSLILNGIHNETNSSGINNTDYFFTKTLAFDDHNWTYEVCNNESQCTNATTRTFSIVNFVENNITFETEVLETSSQDFELNITTIPSILSVNAFLNYNGTLFPSTTTCVGQNCSITNTIDILLVSSGEFENKSFLWEINIFDGLTSISVNSSGNQQNVSRLHLELCNATFPTQALNFTIYDEQTLSRITPFTFDGDFDLWTGGGGIKRNNSIANVDDETALCLSPNQTITIDGIIDYDEHTNFTNYTNRFYYFDTHNISNVSQDIFMYLLESASSTSFILKVQDDSLLPVTDALIEIHRFYPGTGEFRIVQIARTDDNGKSIGFFETETVDYKFIIKKLGVTLLETGQQKVIPETSPFTLTFNIGEPLGEPWSTQQDISDLNSTLTWNNVTGIVTYTYIDNSNNLTQARLFVVKQSLVNLSADTTICNETSTLFSATLTCSVGSTNGFYVASGFISRNSVERLDEQFTFQIETLSGVVGFLGLFYGWFLILIASFMFRFNEIAGIWAITITVFLINLMGLINFGGVFVTAVLVIAVILTWIMEK